MCISHELLQLRIHRMAIAVDADKKEKADLTKALQDMTRQRDEGSFVLPTLV